MLTNQVNWDKYLPWLNSIRYATENHLSIVVDEYELYLKADYHPIEDRVLFVDVNKVMKDRALGMSYAYYALISAKNKANESDDQELAQQIRQKIDSIDVEQHLVWCYTLLLDSSSRVQAFLVLRQMIAFDIVDHRHPDIDKILITLYDEALTRDEELELQMLREYITARRKL